MINAINYVFVTDNHILQKTCKWVEVQKRTFTQNKKGRGGPSVRSNHPFWTFPRFWIIGRGGVVPSWPRSNIFLSNINILDQVFIFLVEIDPNKLHGMTLRPQLHDHEDILSSHFHRHERHNPMFQSLFFGLC